MRIGKINAQKREVRWVQTKGKKLEGKMEGVEERKKGEREGDAQERLLVSRASEVLLAQKLQSIGYQMITDLSPAE